MQQIRTESYVAQQLRASFWRQREHERLIAGGAIWDGMDGYDMTNYREPDLSSIEERIARHMPGEENSPLPSEQPPAKP